MGIVYGLMPTILSVSAPTILTLWKSFFSLINISKESIRRGIAIFIIKEASIVVWISNIKKIDSLLDEQEKSHSAIVDVP